MRGSANGGAGRDEELGDLLSLQYCRIARVGGVPRRVEQERDLLVFDQPADLLTVLGGL